MSLHTKEGQKEDKSHLMKLTIKKGITLYGTRISAYFKEF